MVVLITLGMLVDNGTLQGFLESQILWNPFLPRMVGEDILVVLDTSYQGAKMRWGCCHLVVCCKKRNGGTLGHCS